MTLPRHGTRPNAHGENPRAAAAAAGSSIGCGGLIALVAFGYGIAQGGCIAGVGYAAGATLAWYAIIAIVLGILALLYMITVAPKKKRISPSEPAPAEQITVWADRLREEVRIAKHAAETRELILSSGSTPLENGDDPDHRKTVLLAAGLSQSEVESTKVRSLVEEAVNHATAIQNGCEVLLTPLRGHDGMIDVYVIDRDTRRAVKLRTIKLRDP